jgi:glycosyltransferase involved in cell wall biosynthesis/nucleotide-binding universal stress UspA family protein
MENKTYLSPDILDHLDKVGSADIMVGIPSFGNVETIAHVVKAASAGLGQYFPELRSILVNSDGGSQDATRDLVLSTASPDYVEEVVLSPAARGLHRLTFTYSGTPGKGSAVRAIFEIARRLKVKACVIVDSDLRSIGPEWIELLAGPILKGGYDYVTPLYSRHKYDGTITNNIAYPLTRALYGRRIRQPIGGDFGFSDDFIALIMESPLWDDDVARFGIDIWLTTLAITEGFSVVQARLGAKVHDTKDPGADLGPMFHQVVSTLFNLAGTFQKYWAGISLSHSVSDYGFQRFVETKPIKVDAQTLMERFRLGATKFIDQWQAVLCPSAAERVIEASHQKNPNTGFSAELWAEVVYDFLSSYQVWPADQRPNLIEALTPLHFGRLASFVVETGDMDIDQAEQTIEQQAESFEYQKPHLLNRLATLTGRNAHFHYAASQTALKVPPPPPLLPSDQPERPYTVLVPVANPRTAVNLVRIAASIIGGTRGRAIALGVVEVPEHRSLSEGTMLARRQRRLLQHVSDLSPDSIEFRPCVRIARHAYEGIRDVVLEEQPDLVVLGWPNQEDKGTAVFGTTFGSLISELPCNLAIIRPGSEQTWRRVLVPVRGGPHAHLAMQLATQLASCYGCSVTLLHVDLIGNPQRRASDLRSFETFLTSLPDLDGVEVRSIEVKSLEEGILPQTEGHEVVVMGVSASPEEGGRFALGAVLEAIARKCDATLIAVKTRQAIDPASFVVPELPVGVIVDRWFAENTFEHSEFSNVEELAALKQRQGLSISLGLPALNEAQTIGQVIKIIKSRLMDQVQLLDEIVVIDSGSHDDTVKIAESLGVPVYQHSRILPEAAGYRGKGEALWKSLHVLKGDIIAWVDTDISNMDPKFVYGLVGPLLREPKLQYVKGFYHRPICIDGILHHTGGGRVTELTARPLINLFFPELSGLIQPLSGEYAGRRRSLESIPFFTGYGVEIGILIDMLSNFGLSAIGQVNLDERVHRNKSLADLSRMAFAITQVIICRLEAEKKVQLSTEINRAMKLIVHDDHHRHSLNESIISDMERPPIATLQTYRDRHR